MIKSEAAKKHELAGTLRGLVLKFLTIAAIFTVTPLRATDIGGWTLGSAPLAINAASGRELSGGIHVLRIPDCGGCGWWATSAAIKPSGGVHFRAQAEIVPDNADEKVYNDLMMFVRWEFPKDGKDRSASGNGVDKGEFYQRDFIAYTDRVESGCVIRSFDQVFAAPGECDRVTIEFIGKWHAMTVKISELEVENVPRPTPRKVRCVVGNPHESTFAHEINDTNVFQVRLGGLRGLSPRNLG